MAKLSSDLLVSPQDLYTSSTTQQTNLGTKVTWGSKEYRYCLVGGTALVPGKLYQAPAEITNHQNLTPTAAAIGDTTVTVTLGATAATANQYVGGHVVVTVTPGEGYAYTIKSHPAAAQSASLTLTLEDPLLVAITASSRIDLVLSPFSGVIVNPTTASSTPVGAAVYAAAASTYAWLQTKGPASILADGTVVVGTSVCASNGTAGAVEAFTGVQAPVGLAMTGIATTEYGAIFLNLP